MIRAEADVSMEMMSVEEAKKAGAQGSLEEKYEDKVKVYTVAKGRRSTQGDLRRPHVKNTRELGILK